jgi:hypothetical protein
MRQLPIFKNALTTGLCWGLIGAIIMTLIFSFHGNRPNHPLEITALVLFLAFILLSVFSVKINPQDNKYVKIFLASFITFTIVITSLYLYKFLTTDAPFGFMWKNFFIMTGIGTASCFFLTFLVTRIL